VIARWFAILALAVCVAATLVAIARGASPVARGGQAEVLEPVGDLEAWTCIHRGEGAWNSSTGNGYYGGLQMDRSFMLTYGRDKVRQYGGWAHLWSPRDQIVVAQRAWRTRGYYPWPNTARRCGLI
jgi:hypothetical protein